jgi:hypothetical protein
MRHVATARARDHTVLAIAGAIRRLLQTQTSVAGRRMSLPSVFLDPPHARSLTLKTRRGNIVKVIRLVLECM